ncbi:hypothetical protein NBRC116602_29510 [Hyphomicrobiales bacterium 4NK60-0047b]|jgi:hypothetical protein
MKKLFALSVVLFALVGGSVSAFAGFEDSIDTHTQEFPNSFDLNSLEFPNSFDLNSLEFPNSEDVNDVYFP